MVGVFGYGENEADAAVGVLECGYCTAVQSHGVFHDGEGGSYWASTCNTARQAYALLFIDGLVNASAECTYEKDRGYGRSVRLVRDVQR